MVSENSCACVRACLLKELSELSLSLPLLLLCVWASSAVWMSKSPAGGGGGGVGVCEGGEDVGVIGVYVCLSALRSLDVEVSSWWWWWWCIYIYLCVYVCVGGEDVGLVGVYVCPLQFGCQSFQLVVVVVVCVYMCECVGVRGDRLCAWVPAAWMSKSPAVVVVVVVVCVYICV